MGYLFHFSSLYPAPYIELYVLKVSFFQKDFLDNWILPKNERTNSFLVLKRCFATQNAVRQKKQICSFVFWENSRTPKSPFEIIGPLVWSFGGQSTVPPLRSSLGYIVQASLSDLITTYNFHNEVFHAKHMLEVYFTHLYLHAYTYVQQSKSFLITSCGGLFFMKESLKFGLVGQFRDHEFLVIWQI